LEFKRVLIVDDEEDLTWSISKHLTKDKNKYELLAVNSALEALKILEKLPVELVISDIRMPEMSGLDLLLEIRQNYPSTKVIIMTAYGSHDIQQQANERGCFKYIEKPFEIQELRQMILNIVEEKRGFDGKISDLNLSDLIQMNCLGRLTNALHVKMESQVGVIYFEDGNIVHSEVDELKGEDAFYTILSWEGGSFSIEKGVKASEETIRAGWQTLLLEALKRADESRSSQFKEFEIETEKKQLRMAKILSDFIEGKGVILAALLDKEGFPLASIVAEKYRDEYQIKDITPTISKFYDQLRELAENLKMIETVSVTIEFKRGILHLNFINEKKQYLVVLADSETKLGLLHMECKKVIKAMAEVI
jgi:CheY-like chemotaxis protein/predicted regulator of Ras-like GTPase activity (Roadblock/LC7/MglB family)